MEDISVQDIRRYVYDWNIRFPLDRWWREKHGIPFGSKEHRDANFIDILYEYTEDKMVAEYLRDKDKETEETEVYKAGAGDWLTRAKVAPEQIDKWFNSIKIGNIRETDG